MNELEVIYKALDFISHRLAEIDEQINACDNGDPSDTLGVIRRFELAGRRGELRNVQTTIQNLRNAYIDDVYAHVMKSLDNDLKILGN